MSDIKAAATASLASLPLTIPFRRSLGVQESLSKPNTVLLKDCTNCSLWITESTALAVPQLTEKTNGSIPVENHQTLKLAKNKVIDVVNKFGIALSISQEIDTNLVKNDDEVAIEYFSKQKPNETIQGNYMDFLSEFIEIGYLDKINTYPMD